MSFTRFAFRSAVRPTLMAASAPRIQFLRYSPRAAFSAAAGLPKSEIEARILDLLKSFEKVDPAKVCTMLESPQLSHSMGMESSSH